MERCDGHEALARHDYRLGPAAKELGISRPSLNSLVDKHPTLRRARLISRDEILATRETCDGDLERMWRHLKVSRHSLRVRMSEVDVSL